MNKPFELVSPQAAALERDWERHGRRIHNIDDEAYVRFTRRFKFVNRAALDQVSKGLQILPCPMCMREVEEEGITCTALLVTMEKHPLQDYGSILNAVCHHCGFQQMWPFKEATKNRVPDEVHMSATALSVLNQDKTARMQAMQAKAQAAAPGINKDIVGQITDVHALKKLFEEQPTFRDVYLDERANKIAEQLIKGKDI